MKFINRNFSFDPLKDKKQYCGRDGGDVGDVCFKEITITVDVVMF